jgi:hypothetical protein
MKLSSLTRLTYEETLWENYDLILLASGFEERSCFTLASIPESAIDKCVVLGFASDRHTLSRPRNDAIYGKRQLTPYVSTDPQAYENHIKSALLAASSSVNDRPLRVFIDYSVMTRSWYGYLLTWLRYSTDAVVADVDFVYAYGHYESEFEPLHIEEISAIPGFEGGCAGARRTIAFFGLGYDRYATLAVNELIEPDHVTCYIARETPNDMRSQRVLDQNKELIALSGTQPIYLPLGNIQEAFRILHEHFTQVSDEDEVIAIPMGPKPHVLATLMVSQYVQRVTCLHAMGSRTNPVQVIASGEVSAWRGEYR